MNGRVIGHVDTYLLWAAISVVPLFAGCGGGSNGAEPDGGTTNTDASMVECDVAALFAATCDGSVCHGPSSSRIDLVSPGLEDRLSSAVGIDCSGNLASPQMPEGSLLYDKLQPVPTCGARMPLSAPPLSEAEILCVRDWISGLRPPEPPEVDAGPSCPDCVCNIGEMRDCYDGPSDTVGVGVCVAGKQTCIPTPTASEWGPCDGVVEPSPEQCSTDGIDEDCNGDAPICAERDEWSFAYIGLGTGQAARSVAVDSSDNVYVVGDFNGRVNLGGGVIESGGFDQDVRKDDIFLSKYDANGNHLWSQHWGDTSNQTATQVMVDDEDNVILLGRPYGTINFGGATLDNVGEDDIVVAKFDSAGIHLWSRMFGGVGGDRAERMVLDSAGNIWISGTFTESADFGNGPYETTGNRDIVILKLSKDDGAVLVSLSAGGGHIEGEGAGQIKVGDNYGFGIGVDADDNVYITGYFSESMEITQDGPTLTSAGGLDIFVAKLNADGDHQWSKRFGGPEDDFANDLVVDKARGHVFLTGFFASATIDFSDGAVITAPLVNAGEFDIFTAKLNTDGDYVDSASFGDSANQRDFGTFDKNSWTSLDIDSDGNIYLAGPLVGEAVFGATRVVSPNEKMNAFVVKFRPDGSVAFATGFGGNGTEIGLDVAVTNSGHVMLVGRFYSSSIDFGVSGSVQGVGTGSEGEGFVARVAVQ